MGARKLRRRKSPGCQGAREGTPAGLCASGRFSGCVGKARRGLSQTDAARVLGISRRRLHEIVQGQRSMTPDTAIRCAVAFGTDAAFWLALQAAWDNFHAYKTLRQQSRLAAGAQAAPALPMRWVAPSSLFASRFPGSA